MSYLIRKDQAKYNNLAPIPEACVSYLNAVRDELAKAGLPESLVFSDLESLTDARWLDSHLREKALAENPAMAKLPLPKSQLLAMVEVTVPQSLLVAAKRAYAVLQTVRSDEPRPSIQQLDYDKSKGFFVGPKAESWLDGKCSVYTKNDAQHRAFEQAQEILDLMTQFRQDYKIPVLGKNAVFDVNGAGGIEFNKNLISQL